MILYFETLFKQLDKFLAALLFGVANTTISLHAALQAKLGVRWACWLCGLLNIVQKNHCKNQLDRVPMTLRDYLVAMVLLLVLTGLLIAVPYGLIALAEAVL